MKNMNEGVPLEVVLDELSGENLSLVDAEGNEVVDDLESLRDTGTEFSKVGDGAVVVSGENEGATLVFESKESSLRRLNDLLD